MSLVHVTVVLPRQRLLLPWKDAIQAASEKTRATVQEKPWS